MRRKQPTFARSFGNIGVQTKDDVRIGLVPFKQNARQQVTWLELQITIALRLEHLFDLGARAPFRDDVIACINGQNGFVLCRHHGGRGKKSRCK